MNIFGIDLKQLDLEEARDTLSDCNIDHLPGVPTFLTAKECATILGVSMKIIDQLIGSGELPLIDIPGDSLPSEDLFGEPLEPQRETCILRADLIKFIEKSLLCNKPVLDI